MARNRGHIHSIFLVICIILQRGFNSKKRIILRDVVYLKMSRMCAIASVAGCKAKSVELFIAMLALFQFNYSFFCNYCICAELVYLTL